MINHIYKKLLSILLSTALVLDSLQASGSLRRRKPQRRTNRIFAAAKCRVEVF